MKTSIYSLAATFGFCLLSIAPCAGNPHDDSITHERSTSFELRLTDYDKRKIIKYNVNLTKAEADTEQLESKDQQLIANQPPEINLQKKDYYKTISKEYPLSATGTMDVSNRYGMIKVHSWAENKAKIEVRITVRAETEEVATKIFDQINIRFTTLPDRVQAFTEKTDPTNVTNNGGFWGKLMKGGSSSGSYTGSTDYEIDYDVYMPKTANLVLTNKYGDVYVDKHDGNANINVEYGNVKIEELSKLLKLDNDYGNARVGTMRNGNIEISYGNLSIEDAANLNLDTKYSNVSIEKTNQVISDSKYDTYKIGAVKKITCTGKYGSFDINNVGEMTANTEYMDYSIGQIEKTADFNIKYGELNINSMAAGFTQLHVEGDYLDFNLNTGTVPCNLDCSGNYSDIAFPCNTKYTTKMDDEYGTSKAYRGTKGVGSNKGTIKVKLNYGNIIVK